MSRSQHNSPSPEPSLRSPSPEFVGERGGWDSPDDVEISVSRPASPLIPEAQGDGQPVASVSCLWDKCEQPFSELQALIDHIHNGEHECSHIRISQNLCSYVCTCSYIHKLLMSAHKYTLAHMHTYTLSHVHRHIHAHIGTHRCSICAYTYTINVTFTMTWRYHTCWYACPTNMPTHPC